MGIKINHVGVCRVTDSGNKVLQDYLNLKTTLKNNEFFDWDEIKDELNGNFNDFLLPRGIMANNLQKIVSTGKRLEHIGLNIYQFNYADVEDDDLQELFDEGYLIDETERYKL